MVEIEFIYNGNTTLFQANYSDKFKDIVQKLHLKLDFDINKVYYLYNGKTIENKKLTLNEIIKNIDKERNKMAIQIIEQENIEGNNLIVDSPQVICPQCKSIARMNINDYRIRIYDCINKHDIKDILLENYEKTQKINLTEIICDECKIKNKGNSYRNIFYRCNTCKKNLCPICIDMNNIILLTMMILIIYAKSIIILLPYIVICAKIISVFYAKKNMVCIILFLMVK